jgi:hypothetical protein
MKIIAIGHQKRMGKDSFAKYLITHLRTTRKGLSIQRMGFADKVKDVAHQLYAWAGMRDRQFYEANPQFIEFTLTPINKTPRQIWINIGQSIRTRDNDVWTNYILNRVGPDILIIPDLRFMHEVDFIKSKGGLIVKITNRNVIPTNDEADGALLMNNVEWDRIIENDDGLSELNTKAIQFAEEFKL